MKINWSIRFNAKNKAFLYRVALAIALPILTYFGISLFGKFVSNPYLVGLTIVNILNIIPDPTTKGLGDSEQALSYHEPRNDKEGY